MRDMADTLRLKLPPPLPGEELFAAEAGLEDDEGCNLAGNGGIVWDLTKGAIACLADCSTRKFLKILEPKCDPS